MTLIPEIITATTGDRERVLKTLVLGFAADPVARWIWPEPEKYLTLMPRFAEAFGGRAFENETVYMADSGCAVALWLPPDVEPDGTTMEAILGEGLRPEIAEDIDGFLKGMAAYHPNEPHWYLPLIAADPIWINRGLGAALMKHALRRCDQDGLPAYLESSNPRNISLYERHGFKVIGEIQSGTSPVMTPMLRPPA